jgi:hypothetical protein
MAGKTNTSATFFAQKKLLGKAHTSNLKIDGEETIGSNVQAASSLIFGETIPTSPTRTLNTVQETVEYIEFVLEALSGTTYDANVDGGGSGDDSGENLQTSGPHAYKFKFPDNYESISANPGAGDGYFVNDALVHESLGSVQIVPPFFSQDAPNPYIIKIYQDDGLGNAGTEIPLLDNIDWNIDYYNGILFLQDYSSSKIPAFARGFAYVGKMLSQVVNEITGSGGGGGSGDGDAAAEYIVASSTGSLPNAKLIEAGQNITITTGSNTITIAASGITSIEGRDKKSYFVTSSHSSGNSFDTESTNFSEVAFDPNKIDVMYNGVLMHTGTLSQVNNGTRDYTVNSSGSIVFGFDLFQDDVIDVTLNIVGGSSSSGGFDPGASYLVISSTGSLSNERSINIGSGLQFTDDGAGGNYTIEVEKEMVFNDLLTGNANGVNTLFTLGNNPFDSEEVSIFVNGLLQIPPGKLSFQDFSITGSAVYFTTASTPPEGSWIMANYYKSVI